MSCKFAVPALIFGAILTAGCSSVPVIDAEAQTGAVEMTNIDNATQATLDGSVTIDKAGTYVFDGVIESGQIIVDADKSDKIEIILNGVDITCPTSAAIYVKTADKVTITLADGSVNKLTNTGGYVAIDENNIDAVLYSRDDLELTGSGELQIAAASGNGITSKDDLEIESGVYNIVVGNHAIEANDLLEIKSGSFTLSAGKDGIHAENSDDAPLGNIDITGGTFTINALSDGIDASGTIAADGCTVTMDAGGKGLSAKGDITIKGGSYAVTAEDDAVHSNANVKIYNGTLTLESADDGIHADNNVTISGGEIDVAKSYEGVEGQSIDVTGGTIRVVASDDGFNAAGGNDQSGFGFGGRGGRGGDMFAEDENAYINVSGGYIYVDADGDGIDSNGALNISGGEVYVAGPEGSGNGALDYGGDAQISGGILIAAGASGMAQNMGNASTQPAVLVSFGNNAEGKIVVKDQNGSVLCEMETDKRYGCAVISVPEFEVGKTYTVEYGEKSITVTITDTITGGSGGMGGFGGGGMRPGRW